MPDLSAYFRSRRLRWAVLIFGGYWLIALTIGRMFDWLIITVLLLITMAYTAIAVVSKYTRIAWRGAIENDDGPVSLLSTGIMLGFTGLSIILLATALSGIFPALAWLLNDTRVHGFGMLLYIVAGAIHITARRDERGKFRRGDVILVSACYVAGLATFATLIALQVFGLLGS